MKLKSGVKKKQRQANALKRLEKQLKSGVKTNQFKDGSGYLEIPLTESDIKRINKEVEILKSRV